MATSQARGLFRDLDVIVNSGSLTGLGDAELLVRFADGRGDEAEAAFEAIVARHGPMVLEVCQGILRHPCDADDAFQATFLVLVRKAASVRVADSLGPWLYGVARRVATKSRSLTLRRRSRETTGVETDVEGPSVIDIDLLDARPVLFEELDRLPEKYRWPIVLCHLEGLSHDEAAHRLRWPVGTLSGRLSRARELLRSRLSRRGLVVATGVVAAEFLRNEANALTPNLLRSTTQWAMKYAAGSALPNPIRSLIQGVLSSMLFTKIRNAATTFLAISLLASGACGLCYQTRAFGPTTSQGAVALSDQTERQGRTGKTEGPGANLWAAITVGRPIEWVYKERGDSVTLYFALMNDGDKPIDTKVKSSKLIINDKAYEDWSRIVLDVGGHAGSRRSKRLDSLPPGDCVEFWYGLKEAFSQPGVYRVRWEGEGFKSPEIMFRVIRTTGVDLQHRYRTDLLVD
jgi:RNA polymerase sigma factor (sigma-70 family)